MHSVLLVGSRIKSGSEFQATTTAITAAAAAEVTDDCMRYHGNHGNDSRRTRDGIMYQSHVKTDGQGRSQRSPTPPSIFAHILLS